MACAKHWVDNNQEGPGHNGRLSTSSVVSDRANFEMYYRPYEAAIEAGVGSVMCSCASAPPCLFQLCDLTCLCAADNLVNGTYSCENPRSLTEHLKGALNFSGFVVSDWGADHGSVASLNAGMDMTQGGGFNAATETAILGGAVPQSRIDDAVTRILTQYFQVGVFDRKDYGVACDDRQPGCTNDVRSAAHDALNLKFAIGSTVLLKNEGGVLPLSAGKKMKLGVVGDANNVKGGGSGSVWSTHIVTPAEGIITRLKDGPHPMFGAVARSQGDSAQCADYHHDASIQGHDLGPPPYPGHKTSTAAACCALCAKTPGCAFWSWNPGSPGSCFPKAASAAGHSTAHMPRYAWGKIVAPLPPAPPPPPPPPACSAPLGAAGTVVCNQTATYTSCGMGQCDQNGCTTVVTDADIGASVALAKTVDTVIVNVAVTSTEGFDRYNLSLGEAQDALVTQVAAANPNSECSNGRLGP